MRPLRLGTRGSPLALRQAELVAHALRAAGPGGDGVEVEIVPIRTSGDRLATARLADVGGKGLFVREIDEALLEGHVDLAVHSLKDLPAMRPAALVLAAFPRRADPRDVLVTRSGWGLMALPPGARVGTGSPRRQVQLLARRPDLRVEPVRGNVDTRLRKVREGDLDAVVLAAAGLARLGVEDPGVVSLDPAEMLPAVGQGTLGVEVRADDERTRRLCAGLDDGETRAATLAERTFLETVGGACTTPLAAYGRLVAGALRLDALVATPDGKRTLTASGWGARGDAERIGRELAERMLAAGAGEIIAQGRAA
jgi:hydroxymethylbilane synthase